jgi:heme-degrading monooxygenase HmoA
MIHELAIIEVAPQNHAAFEEAVQGAVAEVLSTAHGFIGFTLTKGVERENTYALLIRWETLEDHTIGFRESELFTQWRARIGGYFVSPPQVDHWTDLFTLGGIA